MPLLRAIPRADQRDEPWANGAGTTTVVLREPDSDAWRIRISVAMVERDGPFSNLPDTRRTLVPLDAPMTLRSAGGSEQRAPRFGVLQFAGAPAPVCFLPEGATRDFNLMLRGDARGEVLPRTLVDAMVLPPEAGTRWLLYLVAGRASLRVGAGRPLELNPQDAALVTGQDASAGATLQGGGEVVLVKLYA